MQKKLEGKRIAVLATQGFEESELLEPKKALEGEGARVDVISPKDGEIKSWKKTDWGKSIPVDFALDAANAKDYDALVLPGGVMNPDHLRMNEKAVEFVRKFVDSGKPIAAICHGPWTLIETGIVKGKCMTSWPSLRTDLVNAGAEWVDEGAVVDGNLLTSRNPDDIPVFNEEMIELFASAPKSARQEEAGTGVGAVP